MPVLGSKQEEIDGVWRVLVEGTPELQGREAVIRNMLALLYHAGAVNALAAEHALAAGFAANDQEVIAELEDEASKLVEARTNCVMWDAIVEKLGIVVDARGYIADGRALLGFDRPAGPSRKASDGCESGKRDYCTCDTCF